MRLAALGTRVTDELARLAGEVNRLQWDLQQLPAGAVDEFVAKYRLLLEARDRLRDAEALIASQNQAEPAP